MKSNDPLDEIVELKMAISSKNISFSEAIEKFSSLLISHKNQFKLDENCSITECLTDTGIKLQKETKEIDKRIVNLNKILVLLELGVTFNDDELQQLLAK